MSEERLSLPSAITNRYTYHINLVKMRQDEQ